MCGNYKFLISLVLNSNYPFLLTLTLLFPTVSFFLPHPISLSAFCLLLLSPLLQGKRLLTHQMADSKFSVSSQDHETSCTGNKYAGLMPKKKPLISKDRERAFFDSADWALCKQGAGVDQKTTVAIETLRPKLQRTAHQQLPPRRPACTS